MSDQFEQTNKDDTFKKYRTALGVTGITVAAALLLAGRQKAPIQYPNNLIEMPESMIPDIIELDGAQDTCMSSFNRIWNENGKSVDDLGFHDQNGKYQDPSFPADASSLWSSKQERSNQYQSQAYTYQNYENQYGIVWKRPTELPGVKNPSLWGKNGVSPKASKQGSLGDCWFLSSASALAAVPSRIHNIFTNTEYSADGAFEVHFYVRGEKVSVVIDDRIPVLNLSPERYVTAYPPINSKPSPAGAWWLVLLEKAFSKLNGNYTQINAGNPGEALRALTGMPVSHHRSSEMTDDSLWDIVINGTERQDPMAAACRVSHHNLVAGHAYGILKGMCLTTNGQCVHKIIKMRNPWGNTKYTGPWSDESSLWTDEWKAQANLANANEGEFWVPLNEWRTDFSSAFDTHYRNDWIIESFEGNPAEFTQDYQQNGFLSFQNTEKQDVVFECSQWNKRLFPPGCKNEYTPQSYAFMFYDTDLNQISTTPNQASCDGGSIKMANLAPGKYIVRVVSFSGSDIGHNKIWKINSYASNSKIVLANMASPFAN